MEKSKFFNLICTLEREELTAFYKFIKRFHPNDKIALSVFDYFKKRHPGFENPEQLELAYAYRQIFNDSLKANPTNRKKILNALSDLHLWLKDFLLLEKIKTDSFEARSLWMSILKERGLKAAFSRTAVRLQQEIEIMPKTSISDYMNGMISNYFFYYQFIHDKQNTDIKVLQDCSYDLDFFYAVCKLKIGCEMANRKNLMSLEFDVEPLPVISTISQLKESSNHPLFTLYFNVYELIGNNKPQMYSIIETLMNEYVQKIEAEELHIILSYLHNYAAAQIRHGNDDFWEMAHHLNKFTVMHGILTRSGEISGSQFTNIVNTACAIKDFTWASNFINNHKQFVVEVIRQPAINIAEAIVLFERKQFPQALKKLQNADSNDLLLAIRFRSLTMKIYYELWNDGFDVEGYALAFEGYLKRHRNPTREVVEATLNAVRIVKMLARRKAFKRNIFKAIETTKPLYLKAWLLEKAGAYLKP